MRVLCFFISILSLISLGDCSATSGASTQDTVRAIQIEYTIPLLSEEGKIVHSTRTDIVYYYQDYIVHQTPLFYDSIVVEANADGEPISQRSVKTEIRARYFVYRPNDEFGYNFDSLTAPVGKRIAVKDFKAGRMVLQNDMLGVYTLQNDSLFERITDGNAILEKYIPRKKLTSAYADSTYLYFTTAPELKSSRFALSTYADSVRKMKLYKIQMIYNENLNTTDSYGKLARQFSFEMKSFHVSNKEQIIDLVKRISQ
jgi:hypothetical protein